MEPPPRLSEAGAVGREERNGAGEALAVRPRRSRAEFRSTQPAYLVSISTQLPTVKDTSAQYSGSSSTSLPSVVHQS